MKVKQMAYGVLAITTIFILGLLSTKHTASAQQETGTRKDQLIGTWMLSSAQNEKNADIFGPNPFGVLVFDASGHIISEVMRADLKNFASPDRTKASPEESQSVMRGSISYFGTYRVTSPGALSLHIINSSFPNWRGTDQKESFVVKGDELLYTNPAPSFGETSVHLLWKRVSAGR